MSGEGEHPLSGKQNLCKSRKANSTPRLADRAWYRYTSCGLRRCAGGGGKRAAKKGKKNPAGVTPLSFAKLFSQKRFLLWLMGNFAPCCRRNAQFHTEYAPSLAPCKTRNFLIILCKKDQGATTERRDIKPL